MNLRNILFFMYVKGVSNFLNIYTVILILFYRVLSIAAFVTEVMTPLRPPAGGRLQPISLDSAWKTPTQDDAVNEGNLKMQLILLTNKFIVSIV